MLKNEKIEQKTQDKKASVASEFCLRNQAKKAHELEDHRKRFITGFEYFDKNFGELKNGLYTIGAPSNMGKTTFCLQLACQMSEHNNVPALYFSCEQQFSDLFSKICARLQYENKIGPTSTENEIGYYSKWNEYEEQKKKAIKQAEEMAIERYKQFYIFTNRIAKVKKVEEGRTPEENRLVEEEEWIRVNTKEVADKTQNLIDKKIGGVIVADYLQLLEIDNVSANKQALVLKTLGKLKDLANSYNAVVILISSLSNEVNNAIKDGKDPGGEFKGSGDIQYHSDNAFLLFPRDRNYEFWKKSQTMPNVPKQLSLKAVKSRMGAWGEFEFDFYGEHSYFKNIPHPKDQPNVLPSTQPAKQALVQPNTANPQTQASTSEKKWFAD